MKKKLSILSILLVLLFALSAFAACAKGTAKVTVLENKEGILVIRADETKEDVSLEDVMNNLKKSGEIQYEISDGMVVSVNGRAANSANREFWALYTSLADYNGVAYSDAEYYSYTYGQTLCGTSSYGVGGLPMIEGNLYILVLEKF